LARNDQDRPRFRRIVGQEALRARVAALAAAINRDHPEGEQLVVVAIMKGAIVFLADLMRNLSMPLQIELLTARSYHGARRREVQVLDDAAELDLHGRRVLLVDTVLDSGHTLAAVRDILLKKEPASLATCVLLSKRRERDVPIEPEYVGMEIPDVFVVGYGLDHGNRWRHLPYVAELMGAETGQEAAHDR